MVAVRWKISIARQFWGCLGNLLQREGAYPFASAMFYRAVVKEVLFFGGGAWVLTVGIAENMEGVHVGLLWQVI